MAKRVVRGGRGNMGAWLGSAFGLVGCAALAGCGETEAGGAGAGGSQAGGAGGTGGSAGTAGADSGPSLTHRFEKQVLHTEFYSEGAHAADVNQDGTLDVIAGPFWYAGPSFSERHTIYAPVAYDPKGYSDNFFVFPHDFNQDTWPDVLVIGFPGQGARWYANPQGAGGLWQRHDVFANVDTESPTFLDLTGDGEPELVCANGGRLGYASPGQAPEQPWEFHPLSPVGGPFHAFTHGLGVGDATGDGRLDVLEASGFWEQPASLNGNPVWNYTAQRFGVGGAQMYALDADGDGDQDIVASLAAHGYGLAWFERTPAGYTQHLLAGEAPSDTPHGIIFHEPHALALGDMNGDGLADIVAGERFWGHVPAGEPNFEDPALLYWFRAAHSGGSASFEPHLVDSASGVGTQVEIIDVDGNGLGDIVVATKKGAFIFKHFTDDADTP